MMKRERLERYCTERGIWFPPSATVEFLQAAIVRAFYNDKVVKSDKKGCFGFWENEDSNCILCPLRDRCFTASIGMDKVLYFKAFEREINPKVRFKNSTSRFSRQPRKRK